MAWGLAKSCPYSPGVSTEVEAPGNDAGWQRSGPGARYRRCQLRLGQRTGCGETRGAVKISHSETGNLAPVGGGRTTR